MMCDGAIVEDIKFAITRGHQTQTQEGEDITVKTPFLKRSNQWAKCISSILETLNVSKMFERKISTSDEFNNKHTLL